MVTEVGLSKLCALEHVDYCEPMVGTYAIHAKPTYSLAGNKRKHEAASTALHNGGKRDATQAGVDQSADNREPGPASKKLAVQPVALTCAATNMA